MDTRNKIIPISGARQRIETEGLTAVQMDCDPLLAGVVTRLSAPLYAFVADKEGAYLSVQARAELAAGLGAVRYVSIGEYPGAQDLRASEAAARNELEQLVLRKSEVR